MIAAILPQNEEARVAALDEYQILDTSPEQAYDDIARLAAFVCGTPVAAITFVDKHRQWFKAIVGQDLHEIPRDAAFCSHTILQPDLLVIHDMHDDTRFADHPLVASFPHVGFYAGMPLITQEGYALGSLCVLDSTPRSLTPEQERALRTLAYQVISQLELRRQITLQERLIADHAQAEAARRQSEARFHAAFHSASVGASIVDLRGHFLFVNQALCDILGYTKEQMLATDFQSLTHLDDLTANLENMQRLRKGQIPSFVIEKRYLRRDGSVVWVQNSVSCTYDTLGRPEHTIALTEDISARKAAQQALHQSNQALQDSAARLVEAQHIAHVGSWELDLTTGKRTWSEELYHICGLDPALGPPSEAVHRACYHPDDLPRYDQAMAELLATGCPVTMDARAVRPSGEIRWCHLTGRLILDAQGRAIQAIGTAADITERVDREQQIRDANLILQVQKTQLQAANKELEALATSDTLTGLLNYRAFQTRLAEEAVCTDRKDEAAMVALLDLNDFRFFNDVYGHSVGDAVLRMVAVRLTAMCRSGEAIARFGGDEFTILLPHEPLTATPAEVEARLRADLEGLSYQPVGEAAAIPLTFAIGAARLSQEDMGYDTDRGGALQQAEERLRRAKSGGDTEAEPDHVRARAIQYLDGFSMLDALVTAIDNKDRYTRKHSEDVMVYSISIAKELGLGKDIVETVAVAALLHDVGKIGVPDAILRKPGSLTQEEFEAVKQHPQMGAIMVNALPGLEQTLDAVRHHHERWDGGGYPFGLREEETPLIARLMAVADAFSAMTTDRPYRKGMDRQKALAILAEGAGTQWDPACVQAFQVAQQETSPAFSLMPAD